MSFCSLRRILPLRHALIRKFSTSSSRCSGHTYYYRRAPDPPPKSVIIKAEVLGGIAWWWILWHIYDQPGHIYGEFPYPDVSAWTDAELGIPPDDEE